MSDPSDDRSPPAVPEPPDPSGSGGHEGADGDAWPLADRRAEFAGITADAPSPPGDIRAFLENRIATIRSAPDLTDEEKAIAIGEVRRRLSGPDDASGMGA